MEHAKENKKEIWTFFQDTEKAFDTVNLEMLTVFDDNKTMIRSTQAVLP